VHVEAQTANPGAVAAIADPVAVAVFLSGIHYCRAIVADVSDPIAIRVSLVGIGRRGAVVARVRDAVRIGVRRPMDAADCRIARVVGAWVSVVAGTSGQRGVLARGEV